MTSHLPENRELPAAGAADDHWAQWIAQSQQGHAESLGFLFRACEPFLLKIAADELQSDLIPKIAASDLVQETFLEMQRDIAGFRGGTEAELRAWLRRILINNLKNHARQFRETAKRQLDRERPIDGGGSQNLLNALQAGGLTPSQYLIQGEARQALEHAVTQLSDAQREAILLRHRDGCSFEEIGKRLNRSADAARMLWWRAIEQLQKLIEPASD
jgi:RNA polymerase sigma-70 factor (ECF subfamily)